MAEKPKGKMKKLMQAQSAADNVRLSQQIRELMEGELSETVRFHMRRHATVLEAKLGMMEDDVLNDVREQLWKGLISYDRGGAANQKTFLSFILANRFKTLSRRASLAKYNCVQYYADVFSSAAVNKADMITEETGEAIYEARQQLAVYLTLMNETDREIYAYLLQGYSLGEMVSDHNQRCPQSPVTRIIITAGINRVQEIVKKQRKLT